MKINFLGDSITAGTGAGAGSFDNMYTTLVGKILGAEINNYGVSGSRIAKQSAPSANTECDEYFFIRAQKMDKDADFVFVFGGTNDYGHGDAKTGCFEDKQPYTFYGALHCLIKYLTGIYGKEKLCFITPLRRYDETNVFGDGSKNEAGLPLSGYVGIIKEVVSRYGVDILDLNTLFPVPLVCTGDEFTTDGLHPNPKGHRIIAEELCKYLRKKFLDRNIK